jgi:hypothetical protein
LAKARLKWRKEPDDGDYAAAATYLSLVLPAGEVKGTVARFRRATTTHHMPKDLERASGEELLPADDPLVKAEIKKSGKGKRLAPALLLRGRLGQGRELLIADGYHRICAGYHMDPEAAIPCRLVDVHIT